jgi:RNA polymerase sigma-B factor
VVVPFRPPLPRRRHRPFTRPAAGDAQLADLHRRYAATRDAALAARLVEQYGPYAASLARRLHRGREPLDDLVQVAMEGLLLALGRYDPDRGVPFPGFAAPTIVGTIRRFFRDSGYAVHIPRPAHDLAGPARDTADRLAQELGRPATVAEVAAALGMAEEQFLTHLSALEARHAVSLDAPMGGGGEPLGTNLGEADPAMRRAEDLVALSQGLALLDDRDRLVLDLYYRHDLTQAEVAERLGVSQVQVSRWIASAVQRLRARLVG